MTGGPACTYCSGTGTCTYKKVNSICGWAFKYKCSSCYSGQSYHNNELWNKGYYGWCSHCGATNAEWGVSVSYGCSHNRSVGGASAHPFVSELPPHECESCKGNGATTKCKHNSYKPHEMCSHNKTIKHD